MYHILGGVLSPMEGIGPQELRFKALFERIETGDVKEVIIATGTSVEGESTAAYIAQQLTRYTVKNDPHCFRRSGRRRLEICGSDDHAMCFGGAPWHLNAGCLSAPNAVTAARVSAEPI